METTEPDWKKIALAMYQELKLAVAYLKAAEGEGLIILTDPEAEEYKTIHWKEQFANTMEMIPGIKVNREVMHAYSLPKKQREKWFKEYEEKLKVNENSTKA